jgi:hypothetical protein
MTLIAVAVSSIMAAVAAIHVYWGLGGLWPGRTEQELIDMIVGDKGRTRMPPAWLTFTVSSIFIGIAAWPLLLAPLTARLTSPVLVVAATVLLAAVFLLRGFVSYIPAFARLNAVEPFATLNRRYYGPLCIALGAGYLALALNGGLQ